MAQMNSQSSSSELDSEEFFDAAEQLSPASRGNSLRRQLAPGDVQTRGTAVMVTSGSETPNSTVGYRTANQTLARGTSPPSDGSWLPQSTALLPDPVLPEEIERELNQIFQGDDERKKRISRLRKLQKESGDEDDEDTSCEDDDEANGAVELLIGHRKTGDIATTGQEMRSEASSVEGFYPTRHPFKVVEPDTRSNSSETRSLQGRSGSRSNETGLKPQNEADVEKRSGTASHFLNSQSSTQAFRMPQSSSFPLGAQEQGQQPQQQPVPDIVSSIPTEICSSSGKAASKGSGSIASSSYGAAQSVGEFHGTSSSTEGQNPSSEIDAPNRPPRRKQKETGSQFGTCLIQSSSSTSRMEDDSLGSPIYHSESQRPQNLLLLTCDSNTPTSFAIKSSTPRLQSSSTMTASSLPSPHSTVASITKELESSLLISPDLSQNNQQPQRGQEQRKQDLDLKQAMQGQYVVKPQDDERSRGNDYFSRDENGRRKRSVDNKVSLVVDEPRHQQIFCQDESYQGQNSAKLEHQQSLPSVAMPLSSGIGGGSGEYSTRVFGRAGSSSGSRSFKSLVSGSGSGGRRSSMTKGAAGHSSLGSKGAFSSSAGGSIESKGSTKGKQLQMFLRTKSDSGKKLSEEEILKQIKVKNLDTGEEMDLVEAEDQLPKSINPLSLHIMRLTSEYVSGGREKPQKDSDTESLVSSVSGYDALGKKKKNAMRKFLGGSVRYMRKTTDAARTLAVEATKRKSQKELLPPASSSTKDVEKKLGRLSTDIKSGTNDEEDGSVKFKRIQAHKSGPFDFENIKFAQELPTQHLGPIWCMKFSQCGQLLATAGQDKVIQIWVVRDSYEVFKDMRSRYNSDVQKSGSPTSSYDNVIADQEALFSSEEDKKSHVFNERPLCTYQGHTSDVLDICWSKNYFLLSSSMDKTVRLWHISRRECLCCFQHIDFVTALAFHPRNDQFFLSASLDGKLRLWNIPDKKVTLWNEIDGGQAKLITAANFIQNGKFAVVGTYDGRCIFYSTDQLKYYTMIHVRSTRGKNAQGRKVTGIEPMPGEDKILVTSNDSRIRIYDLRDLSLTCKYKGYTNSSSQIRATFSHDGKYITAGSENHCVFLWKTQYESTNLTTRKDRNSYYEAIKAHNAVVTCSVFATNPDIILNQILRNQRSGASDSEVQNPTDSHCNDDSKSEVGSAKSREKFESNLGYVIVSGDYDGDIKVFYNFTKPKHSSLP